MPVLLRVHVLGLPVGSLLPPLTPGSGCVRASQGLSGASQRRLQLLVLNPLGTSAEDAHMTRDQLGRIAVALIGAVGQVGAAAWAAQIGRRGPRGVPLRRGRRRSKDPLRQFPHVGHDA